MFSLRFRDILPTPVLDELESLVNQIKGFLSVSFNEDGTLIAVNPALSAVSIGVPIPWLTNTPPAGHLLLDGSQKNRVAYKTLFDLWGTTFGAGDGSTTFNLPDMRGRMFLGKTASGTGAVLGEVGGAIDHTHSSGTTGATAPSISGSTAGATATISGSTASESSHTHPVAYDRAHFTLDAGGGLALIDIVGNATGAGSAHSHGAGSLGVDSHAHGSGSLAVASHTHTGGATGTANPPYFVGNWIVFAGV